MSEEKREEFVGRGVGNGRRQQWGGFEIFLSLLEKEGLIFFGGGEEKNREEIELFGFWH